MKKKMAFLGLILAFEMGAQAYPLTPDPEQTNGDLCSEHDRHFMARKYPEKIPVCRRHVEGDLKRRVYRTYDIPDHCRRNFTVDHLIPLSIGGSNAFANLWPEHLAIKAGRLHFEEEVFDQVREGQISQQQAIDLVRQRKFHPTQEEVQLMVFHSCDVPD